MKYFKHGDEVELTEISDFDLDGIFRCGQCFRWNADNNGIYTGIAYGKAASLRRSGESIYVTGSVEEFEKCWLCYFDLNRDYAKIRRTVSIDDYMQKATDYGTGIRILRQESWEALCSFIISQRNNIPRIKKIITSLCEEFGDKIIFSGKDYYAFPQAEKLAELKPSDLAQLRCGYRADYIISAARSVAGGEINLAALANESLEDARRTLKGLRGVGDKVADCVALFGLNMLDAFPVDVWIKRVIDKRYGTGFNPSMFHPYAGVAQQYMFHYERSLTLATTTKH